MLLQRPVLLAIGVLALGCAASSQMEPAPPPEGPPPELTASAVLCKDASLEPDDFCLPAERVEPLLRSGEGDILYHKITETGVSRPSVLHIGHTDGSGERIVFKAKWKIAPPGGVGFNNTPHKEIAAFEAQKLFLDPEDFVVPPNIGYCMPLDRHARSIGVAEPTFPGTTCVFGVMAYWVVNVTPANARDMERAESDEAYRDALARLNLFTYLIDHRDPRDANFLVSKDPDRPRVFSIDNGLAFGGFTNPFTFYYGDWGDIRVPALSRKEVDRLRGVTREDVEALAVVAQFENRDGRLVSVQPSAPFDPDEPVRVSESGDVIQLGLTREEVDTMDARIRKLIERVDAGEIPLF